MLLLDIFKKKKTQEKRAELKAKERAKTTASSLAPSARKRDSVNDSQRVPQSGTLFHLRPAKRDSVKEASGIGYRALKKPRVTEKAADLAEKNQYVFEVYPRTNKKELKQAIGDIYGVDVVSARIINMPKKKRRLGKIEGYRKGYKKAIIRIKEGQKIEVLPR